MGRTACPERSRREGAVRVLNEPISWWGWHGWADRPEPLSIVQILRSGTLPPELVAVYWLSLERGASLLFAADPPGAGKTALLTALLTFLPEEAPVYFTRGWGETFDLPPLQDGTPTYILVNEMSDHLPVYSWGPYVQRIFELMAQGYSMVSTMHADTVEEVLEQLEGEVGVPRAHLAHLTLVSTMYMGYRGGRVLRRVNGVSLLGSRGSQLQVSPIASWNTETDSFSVLEAPPQVAALAGRLQMEERALRAAIDARSHFLESLVEGGVSDQAQIERAVAEFRRSR